MNDYQQNYSGFPIDPAPAPPAPEGNDAERTAYLPPVPHAYPSGGAEETALLPPFPGAHPGTDPSYAMQSRFGHIEAKYGSGEVPQAAALSEPGAPMPGAPMPGAPMPGAPMPAASAPAAAGPQEQASPWPEGWERPAAPPPAWSPAPQAPGHGGRHPYPAPGDPTPGDLAPQQPWDRQAPAPVAPLGEPSARPHGASGHAQPGAPLQTPFGPDGHAAYPGPGRAPAEGFAPGRHPHGAHAGPGAAPLAAPQPMGPGGPGAQAGAGQAQAYGAYPGGPGGPGGAVVSEQPLGTAGGSLREAFASAEPTGPGRGAPEGVHVGAVLAPGQSPLEAGGGSLREAFAEAQPTGPGIAPTASATVVAPRTRTGSPIIDPGVQPAAITLVLGALIGVAGLAGKFGLVVPVALLQAVTAAGWFRLNGMWPARQGIALAALGGFVADAAILAASAHSSGPAIIAGTLGAFFLLVLILQIFRPSNPDERFYALTVCASATVVTVLAGGYLAVGSGEAVLAGALAAGVSAAVSAALRKPPVVGFAAGGFLGLLVGGGVAVATGLGLTEGLLLGLGAGGCALIGRRVAAFDFPSRFVHMTAGVALPLALAAPMVYLIAR